MTRAHTRWFALALVLLWASQVASATERLVIVSPHWEGLRYEFGRVFSAWHQQRYGAAVEIDWRDVGGTSDDLRFVVSEFKQRPAGIGIDLFFGGGIDPYYDLAGRGLLASYQPPAEILGKIPAQLGGVPVYDPQYRWFGVALASFGILYNQRLLELRQQPRLETWRDLAERAPVGSVGSGDPRNSGSTHMVYELILQRYGWEEGWSLINQLAAKIQAFDRSASGTAKDVVIGNTTYGLTIDFYALTEIAYAGRTNLGFALPTDCVVVNPDGIAILRGAPNPAVARRMVDFVLSEAGQGLLMLPKGTPGGAQKFSIERMSVLPELYQRLRETTLIPINPFECPISFRYDPKKGAARWGIVNGLIGSAIIDVQPELIAAWRRIEAAGKPAAAVRRFGEVPLTEEEAARLAVGRWNDPAYRQRTLIEWQRWAQRKFGEK